eukprot:1529359-Prymnesium_polylepis.1
MWTLELQGRHRAVERPQGEAPISRMHLPRCATHTAHISDVQSLRLALRTRREGYSIQRRTRMADADSSRCATAHARFAPCARTRCSFNQARPRGPGDRPVSGNGAQVVLSRSVLSQHHVHETVDMRLKRRTTYALINMRQILARNARQASRGRA